MTNLNELVGWNWWYFALLFEGMITFLGNMLTTAVFWRRRAALRRASYLLINLAIADLLVGVGAIAFSVHGMTHYNASESAVFYNSWEILISFFAAASICTLTIIAVERAFAITKPLKHRAAPTAFYYRAIGFVWAMATVITGLLMMLYAGIEEIRFALTTFCAACLLTIFLSYFAIWLSSKRRLQQEDIRAQERNKKLATNLLILTMVSLAMWVPMQVLLMFSHEDTFSAFGNKFVLFIFEVANSLLNPFVYTLRMPEYRRELRRLCICGQCDHRSKEVMPTGRLSLSNQTAAEETVQCASVVN